MCAWDDVGGEMRCLWVVLCWTDDHTCCVHHWSTGALVPGRASSAPDTDWHHTRSHSTPLPWSVYSGQQHWVTCCAIIGESRAVDPVIDSAQQHCYQPQQQQQWPASDTCSGGSSEPASKYVNNNTVSPPLTAPLGPPLTTPDQRDRPPNNNSNCQLFLCFDWFMSNVC